MVEAEILEIDAQNYLHGWIPLEEKILFSNLGKLTLQVLLFSVKISFHNSTRVFQSHLLPLAYSTMVKRGLTGMS